MKVNRIFSIMFATLVMGVATVVTSCGGGDDPVTDPVPAPVEETTLSVSPMSLNFETVKGDVQHFTISSNKDWKIVSAPDWLDINPLAGNGTTPVELKTIKENSASSSERSATIVIQAEDKTVEVSVKQYAGLAKGTVSPRYITTLAKGIAFEMAIGGNVSYYYVGYLESAKVGIMSETEIIYILEHDERFDRKLASEKNLISFNGLTNGTRYYIYTIAYDDTGARGKLMRFEISTNALQTNEPRAWLTKPTAGPDSKWYWTTTKSATCNYYYMLVAHDPDMGFLTDVEQAWYIDKAIRDGKTTENLNGGNWTAPMKSSTFFVWTRGVDLRGIKSSVIDWDYATTQSSSSVQMQKKESANVGISKILDANSYSVYKFQ